MPLLPFCCTGVDKIWNDREGGAYTFFDWVVDTVKAKTDPDIAVFLTTPWLIGKIEWDKIWQCQVVTKKDMLKTNKFVNGVYGTNLPIVILCNPIQEILYWRPTHRILFKISFEGNYTSFFFSLYVKLILFNDFLAWDCTYKSQPSDLFC